uniref:RNA-directed RNA polymerase n=1 Tax=Beihai levi-like virus 21 TaxID=1922407 RepID=A0A1L3KIE3_9VIRU|nr:hypothetical protein [Beihai levi-like virus 21]
MKNFKFSKPRRLTDDLVMSTLNGLASISPANVQLDEVITAMKEGNAARLISYSSPFEHESVWPITAYDTAVSHFANNLYRKSDFLELGIDTLEAAKTAFYSAEEACRLTNERLIFSSRDGDIEAIILMARRKISRLLRPFNVEKLEPYFRHGSGATTRSPRKLGDEFFKWENNPEVTHRAAPLLKLVLGRYNIPYNLPVCVSGSLLQTVPKTAKTDRPIAIEPEGNMFLQLGAGGYIRRQLRRVGIDLNDQALNQRGAQLAIDENLATVDLSAASDSISIELVKLLLPADWFMFLDAIRSHVGTWGERKQRFNTASELVIFNKFSSMGNGFTFELESLIFWALSDSVREYEERGDTRLNIYGDDIVIHRDCISLLTKVFSYVGFTINTEKSFTEGPFFESCGSHYFNGALVTPLYVKSLIDDLPTAFWFINQVRRWYGTVVGYMPQAHYDQLIKIVKHHTPAKYRYMVAPAIPDGVGDNALIGSISEVRPRFSAGTFHTNVFLPKIGKRYTSGVGQLVKSLIKLERVPASRYRTMFSARSARLVVSSLRSELAADVPVLTNRVSSSKTSRGASTFVHHEKNDAMLVRTKLRCPVWIDPTPLVSD